MSTLILAPFNDSMRLGQGYNSFLQTPCLGNAVEIGNATLVESRGSSSLSQTVSYSARFVEKMSDVVHAMNISAGSSIRTGSVSVSGGGNNIDEIKFAESDLNAVISVKVVNQTRNLQDNVSFHEIDVQKMDNTQFHEVYGDTFISGFIEGGDLHGIVSIKTIDASKRTEVKNKLKSQFNGSHTEWSPSSSAALDEVLRQAEVTVTVNWSGGGLIKPSNEEWTIESLIRAASAFPDNVAQCPQRTWAILTRYDTIPSFVVWSSGLTNPIRVKRYEGVQRFTSELLDMYIEHKGNLLILNDVIRHPERYEISSHKDKIEKDLDILLNARSLLRKDMNSIVEKIEALDKDPSKLNDLQREVMTAPELWRARLPIRKDQTGDLDTQNGLQFLLGNLPINDRIGDKPKQLEQPEVKALQAKLTQLEETNKELAKNLDSTKAELTETKNKSPSSPEEKSNPGWVQDGLCPEKQLQKMPRYIKRWAKQNATKWSDCRISWTICGLDDFEKDGSPDFKCTLDHITPQDGHVMMVEVFSRKDYFCGLKVHYASDVIVEHGDCSGSLSYYTNALGNSGDGFIVLNAAWARPRPQQLDLSSASCRYSSIKCPEKPSWGVVDRQAMAPPGYYLRGFWTQYEGDGFERLGFIWGRHLDPDAKPTQFEWFCP